MPVTICGSAMQLSGAGRDAAAKAAATLTVLRSELPVVHGGDPTLLRRFTYVISQDGGKSI